MRLIDADWIVQRLEGWQDQLAETYGENDEYVLCIGEVLMKLDDTPTVSAPDINVGKWIAYGLEDGFAIERYSCSKCGYDIGVTTTNYCPNCGAKMDLPYFNYPRWNGKSMTDIKKFFEEMEDDG